MIEGLIYCKPCRILGDSSSRTACSFCTASKNGEEIICLDSPISYFATDDIEAQLNEAVNFGPGCLANYDDKILLMISNNRGIIELEQKSSLENAPVFSQFKILTSETITDA